MPRAGELNYYERLGDSGRQHAIGKPFSDDESGLHLQRVGALFNTLPPPPARILECGCGTGWLSYFLAQRGYEVVATDVAPDAIRLAKENPKFLRGPTPDFQVANTESLSFESEFDVVIFFDSLHHADDEESALKCAYRALRPGGICVTLEPGLWHQRRSKEFVAIYDVTEKDMPPTYIRRMGRKVGFTRCVILPDPKHMGIALYGKKPLSRSWLWKLLGFSPFKLLAVFGILAARRWYGITILHKDA